MAAMCLGSILSPRQILPSFLFSLSVITSHKKMCKKKTKGCGFGG